MVGQLNELSTALVLQFALILYGALQDMDAIVDIHLRHELQFSLLGPHDHRAAVIPKVFGRPLIASRLRNRILASRAIDQRNLRQQIILGGEHDSCKIPDSRYERAETRRAISLSAR